MKHINRRYISWTTKKTHNTRPIPTHSVRYIWEGTFLYTVCFMKFVLIFCVRVWNNNQVICYQIKYSNKKADKNDMTIFLLRYFTFFYINNSFFKIVFVTFKLFRGKRPCPIKTNSPWILDKLVSILHLPLGCSLLIRVNYYKLTRISLIENF